MAEVFENSFVTLAASSASDDTGSLFMDTGVRSAKGRELSGLNGDGVPYQILVRRPIHHYLQDEYHGIRTCRRWPLITRAWAFHERLLAPRVLYLGEEITWEVCECSGATPGLKLSYSTLLTPNSPIATLHNQWRNLVTKFTRLRLSHEKDRLPAPSGAAKQIQSRLESRYLAGLWEDNLV